MVKAFGENRFLSVLFVFTFLLQACAPDSGQFKLPDDPDNESASNSDGSDTVKDGPDGEGSLPPPVVSMPPENEHEVILKQYDYLDPNRVVPTKSLEEAALYFHENKSKFTNQKVLSIIDFNQSSTQKRWHIIDMETGSVWSLHVAHGKGSDANHDGYAEKFSNVSGSNASSVGFYKTAETYHGKHGYSLRLDGLSGTNSNARARAIVVHGADYVQDRNVIQGRSWGCPAISLAHYKTVINMIKGGSLIYGVGGDINMRLSQN